ncbi:hypothetical protein BP6252_04573 [Coleophoma cylindrospora]|uniref:Uncharacterized protein n=1 Tax=Coleophoma cylindrospora TaxID=1849047 RepID=A0A3D8S0X6_9HELO|nr:hypothetical protein BP6252_04573 [Coleophoma cylindrospora]
MELVDSPGAGRWVGRLMGGEEREGCEGEGEGEGEGSCQPTALPCPRRHESSAAGVEGARSAHDGTNPIFKSGLFATCTHITITNQLTGLLNCCAAPAATATPTLHADGASVLAVSPLPDVEAPLCPSPSAEMLAKTGIDLHGTLALRKWGCHAWPGCRTPGRAGQATAAPVALLCNLL